MLALPSHRSGILLYPSGDIVFVHKEHDILKPKWLVNMEHARLVNNTHYRLAKADVQNACLHLAQRTIIRLQRWAHRLIYAPRRLAVAMAFNPRLGSVCGLATLKEDVVMQILSIDNAL
jgi:hypothetical protein